MAATYDPERAVRKVDAEVVSKAAPGRDDGHYERPMRI